MGNQREKVASNFTWRLFERIGAQGVTFIVSIVLARLLDPSVYGTIALVTVFITILQIFVDGGFSNALIQKKDADETDFSSVFYFNMAMCVLLYILMYLCAPFIAEFYNNTELTPVIRVLSVVLVIYGVKSVQQAYVSRHMMFKRFFFATLGGTLGAGVIGIWMAWSGYGVWALVAQHVFNTLVDTIILWIMVKWRPRKVFSFDRLKALFSFGWKILVSSLINTVYNEIRQLIIGKMYSSSDLAYYNRARQFPNLFVTNINSSIDSVLLPTMSNVQDDKTRVKSMTRRAIKTSTYIMAPMMMGLAACGETVVKILLTDKWLPCVPYMVVFCVAFMFQPIHTANLNAIKAMGRSDLYLKLEIWKKAVGIIALVISMPLGVMAMAYSMLITNVIAQVINSWPNKKLLDYSYIEQLKDILPDVALAAGMGLVVYALDYLGLNKYFTLLLQVLVGVVIYIAGSKLFRLDSYDYVLGALKEYIKKFTKKESNNE